MKILSLLVLTIGISTQALAANQAPKSFIFALPAQTASEIATKEFCQITAGAETYNHIVGSTSSESLQITCDGKTVTMGGEVRTMATQRRVDEILGEVMGQVLKMGFKVVSCETDKRVYRSQCIVAKSVLSPGVATKLDRVSLN